jgi:glutamine cyclotransferase
VDVLNEIAYDKRRDRFFVMGKLCQKLFEIKLFRRD